MSKKLLIGLLAFCLGLLFYFGYSYYQNPPDDGFTASNLTFEAGECSMAGFSGDEGIISTSWQGDEFHGSFVAEVNCAFTVLDVDYEFDGKRLTVIGYVPTCVNGVECLCKIPVDFVISGLPKEDYRVTFEKRDLGPTDSKNIKFCRKLGGVWTD